MHPQISARIWRFCKVLQYLGIMQYSHSRKIFYGTVLWRRQKYRPPCFHSTPPTGGVPTALQYQDCPLLAWPKPTSSYNCRPLLLAMKIVWRQIKTILKLLKHLLLNLSPTNPARPVQVSPWSPSSPSTRSLSPSSETFSSRVASSWKS